MEEDIWTQKELHEHVRSLGMVISDDEEIPQCVKFFKPGPITEKDIEWAKKMLQSLDPEKVARELVTMKYESPCEQSLPPYED